jgi:lipopolysaccharide transport system permease protein
MAVLMLFKGIIPPWQIVFAPLFFLLAVAAALGFGLLLCAVNVRYRDVRYVLPFIVQFGLFVSPIGFSSSLLSHGTRFFFNLNPMVLAIDGLRWSILGVGHPFAGGRWILSLAVTALALWAGVRYFRKTERTFADVI